MTDFTSIKIEHRDEPFVFEQTHYRASVLVYFLNRHNEVVQKKTYGYLTESDINNQISSGNPLNIPHAYVDFFSIKHAHPSINFGQTTGALFFADHTIDFSNITFTGQQTHFTQCLFFAQTLDFSNSVFLSQSVIFDQCSFNLKQKVNFTQVQVTHADFALKNCHFSNCIKNFEHIRILNNSFIFNNNSLANGDILFNYAHFSNHRFQFKINTIEEGRVDFNHCQFGDADVFFEKNQFGTGTVNFRSAKFGTGKKDFTRCEFGTGTINFTNTQFHNGDISFAGSIFQGGKLSFKMAEFGTGKKDFHYCVFNNIRVIFERTIFSAGELDFRAVNFGTADIDFHKIQFDNGDLIFEACEKQAGNLMFREVHFGAGFCNFNTAQMNNAHLKFIDSEINSSRLSFLNAIIKTIDFTNSQLRGFVDLRMQLCQNINLSSTIIENIIDLRQFSPEERILGINFSNLRLLGHIYLDWDYFQVEKRIEQQDTALANKADQFRMLKENFNQTGQYHDEDEAYVLFKRYEAKANLHLKKNRKPHRSLYALIQYAFQWLVFDKMGRYATDPMRVLLSMVIVYLLFTVVYWVLPFFSDTDIVSSLFEAGDPRDLSSMQKAFYHSAITFLTIGYGDYYPSGIIRWISSIEGFTGLFMMSYFTVAFVRKILR